MTAAREQTLTDVWDLPYRHSAGRDGSLFLRHLRDHGELLAKHCHLCRLRSLPPCPCPVTGGTEWHPAGPDATVIAAIPIRDKPGWWLALLRIDGSDSSVVQRVRFPRSLRVERRLPAGTKLRSVFADERHGAITDFWFEAPGMQDPATATSDG